MAAASNKWSTGFCSWCADPDGFLTCLYVSFCPCCAYGSNVGKMGPGEACCGGNCCCACFGYTLLWDLGLCCLVHMQTRAAIRVKYGINGSACNDCLLTCICPLCATCQERRELAKSG